jgi:hypothetical protein
MQSMPSSLIREGRMPQRRQGIGFLSWTNGSAAKENKDLSRLPFERQPILLLRNYN